MITIVTVATLIVTLGTVAQYEDTVFRHELRIQSFLNAQACKDSVELIRVKDYFVSGQVYFADFGCEVNL